MPTRTVLPFPTPDHRWQRAAEIVDRGGYATIRRDGRLVQRAVHYAKRLNRVVTERGVRGVARKYPDIFLALRLANEVTRRPLEVRARALAQQSDRTIGRAVGLPAPTIATYLDLFFDVRPRLECNVWIRRVAIGLPLVGPPCPETLMLLQAWRHGPGVIEAWLDYLAHQCEYHDLKTIEGRQRAGIELLIATQNLPFDAETNDSLRKRAHITLGKLSKTPDSGGAPGVFRRIVARKLGEIAWKDASGVQEATAGDRPRLPVTVELPQFGGHGRVA